MSSLVNREDIEDFSAVPYAEKINGTALMEIRWMKINFAAQW